MNYQFPPVSMAIIKKTRGKILSTRTKTSNNEMRYRIISKYKMNKKMEKQKLTVPSTSLTSTDVNSHESAGKLQNKLKQSANINRAEEDKVNKQPLN